MTRRLLLPRSTPSLDAAAFWAVIATMPPGTPVRAMVSVLRGLSPAERRAFAHHLADAVVELDTPAHRRETALAWETRLPGDPEVGWTAGERAAPKAMPVELRLTVVALGQEAWAAVVCTPALLRSGWPTQLGRRLAHALAVADGLGLPDDVDGLDGVGGVGRLA